MWDWDRQRYCEETVISCLCRVRQALKLGKYCSTSRIQQWAGALPLCLLAPAVFLDLFKKASGPSCSSKLWKMLSTQRGRGLHDENFCCFSNSSITCLWKQGAESKGCSQICSQEPHEAPLNEQISVVTGMQPRAPHSSSANATVCPAAAWLPSPGLPSPSPCVWRLWQLHSWVCC